MQTKFQISTDKKLLDIAFIHNYLSEESYWAKGRSVELVKKSITNSLCFGVFNEDKKQIGFARVATDYTVFAWLMDVFIDSAYQKQGIGKALMHAITKHPELAAVNGIGLRTNDAGRFYETFGFESIAEPNTWMIRKKK